METYDINFLAGQLLAQRAVLLGLATLTSNQQELHSASMVHLENLKAALLSEPVPDRTLDGIAEVETWLSTVTGQA